MPAGRPRKCNHSTVISNYKKGMSIEDISSKHNVTRSSVYGILKKNGIWLDERPNKRDPEKVKRDKKIVSDFLKGLTKKQLSERHKMKIYTIHMVLIRALGRNKTLEQTAKNS